MADGLTKGLEEKAPMRKFRLVDACEKENINRGNFPLGKMSEDSPVTSAEAAQRPEGVRRSRNHHGGSVRGGGGGGGELSPSEDQTGDERRSVDKEQEEKAHVHRAVGVLRELGASQADKLTALRGVIRECAFMLQTSPPGGGVQQRPSTAGCKTRPKSDHLSDIFHSVEEDMEHILDKLQQIITKLDLAVLQLSSDRASANVAEGRPESKGTDSSVSSQAPKPEGTGNNPVEIPPGCEPQAEDDQNPTRPSSGSEKVPETGLRISDCNKVEENREQLPVKQPVFHFPEKLVHCQANKQEETQKETEEKREENNFMKKEEKDKKEEWVTVGLTGQMEGSCPDEADGCLIRAPVAVAKVLRCETADQLSCLMVSGSEELVSRVVRVEGQSGASFHFPLTVAVPFCVRHRGSYRDVAVKIISEERRVSYVTPVTTEGVHGGRQGTFAEAKVYSLGLFAVVYCLKRENYIIPKRGLSLKLPMDSRICLNYLPGSFTAPVMAQTMVQPVDAVLLAAVRSRDDAYKPVVSASPLLYLTHPNTQPLRRTLTITLPCPPNPEKNREARGQDPPNCQRQTIRAALPSPARLRTMTDTLKSQEISGESLILLGSRDAQWSVLDNVAVRNVQNGLVSFELEETWDRLLVVRLLSPLQPCHLASLAEELVESSRCHSVTVILQRQKEEPRSAVLAALPSRELSWELGRLRAQGCGGLVDTSAEISMCEADQLVLRFSGNITGSAENDKNEGERLTFHSQRRNRLLVHLTELDPFGNYSSPHYKGTALFYRVSRGRLEWGGDKAVLKDSKLLGDPVCKMPLTLPKKVRVINRPTAARVKLCEETEFLSDALLLWLAGELSREETALLVSSLRLRRSTVQLVKLRAGDSPPAQAFHVLATWRRAQPSVPHQPKASQLAQSLARSGRPDLARELLLRQAELSEARRLRKQSSQCGRPAAHGQKN